MINKVEIIGPEELPKDGQVSRSSMSITYVQPDSEKSGEYQELVIETGDNGGGIYFKMSTDLWSVDNIEELETILKDFKDKVGI